mgnify:CR=1 FL=1
MRLHLLCILRPQVSKNPLRRTLTVQEHETNSLVYRILFKGEFYDSFLVTSLLLLLLLALP